MLAWILQQSDTEAARQAGEAIGRVLGLSCMCIAPILFVVAIVMAIRKRSTGWTIAACISGLPVLGLAGLFAFGVLKGIDQAGRVPSVVVSTDRAVQLRIPPTWTNIPGLHDEASLEVGNTIQEQYLIVLTDRKADFAGTLEDHVDTTTTAMLAAGESHLQSREPITLGEYDAIRAELTIQDGLMKILYFQYTIETEDSFHQILTWTLPSKREEALPVFDKVIRTFEEVRD